jgi:hypothetical protein
VCANWTGAHLISRGCILYGTLTMEMAMRMPRGTQCACVREHARCSARCACVCAPCAQCVCARSADAACAAPAALWDIGTYVYGGKPDPSWHAFAVLLHPLDPSTPCISHFSL